MPEEDDRIDQDESPEQATGAPDEASRADATTGLRDWFGRLFHKADEHDLEPLELRARLLDKIEQALKRFRSTRPLPFNRITVHVLAPTSNDRLPYESALHDLDAPFDQAARHRLYNAGFDLPDDLDIKAKIHAKASKHLQAAFEEAGPVYVELKQHAPRASATITVERGKAERATYQIRSTDQTFNIGRLRDVVDDHYGHLVRHNDIAFLDHNAPKVRGENRDINETVSRRHARIEFDARSGSFVLVNEQGVTSVSRAGYPQPVRVTHQAVPLQDGDLIYLGRACLKFETRRRG
jgi:hypothetical protein